MTRVTELVGELRKGPRYTTKINQTVPLPPESYYKLRALGEFMERPYSNLAGKLLVAAIDDAIEALPDDERQIWSEVLPLELTARGYVLERAREKLWEALAEEDPDRPTISSPRGQYGEIRKRQRADASSQAEDED